MPGFPVLHYFPNVCSNSRPFESMMLSKSHPLPLFFFCLQFFPASDLFRWVGSLHQVANWNISFSISSTNEYSRFISFRIYWFDLLAIQETLKHLQHHSSKASILQCSAFFMIQLSHLYMTTGGLDGKASVYNAGDPGSNPGSGRSPGEGNGNPLHYSCLGNPMYRADRLQSMLSQREMT